MPSAVRIDGDKIQGNVLVPFNKDHQTFLFVRLPTDLNSARALLAAIIPRVTRHRDVATFNALYKTLRRRDGSRVDSVLSSTWVNLAFTHSGLARLGHSEDIGAHSVAFREGLAHRATRLGHVGASAPSTWTSPFSVPDGLDAVIIVAADHSQALAVEVNALIAFVEAHGGALLRRWEGNVRPDLPGHEHFGFKDGVSQPGVRGVTRPNPSDPDQGAPGQDLIWPGEFVLGYPAQSRLPDPDDQPGPPTPAVPAWTRNGSFLVVQRLLQDVALFEQTVAQLASSHGIAPALLAAKFVGRHKSGCPLEIVEGIGDVGQTHADVASTHPELLRDEHINDFEYDGDVPGAGDGDGHVVPRAAHIRKMYPRDAKPPGEQLSATRRILRRGIAFGPPYAPGEPATTERGLLFACYQADIEAQFEFLQASVGDNDFTQTGDGADPVLNEATGAHVRVPGLVPSTELSLAPFVRMSGGAYFFAPSIPALRMLARVTHATSA